MDKNNFEELKFFKSVVKDPKRHEIPSFEGVSVTLEDPESAVCYGVPVNLIDSISNVPTATDRPKVQIKLKTGDSYFALGTVTEILGKVIEAKIKGGTINA